MDRFQPVAIADDSSTKADVYSFSLACIKSNVGEGYLSSRLELSRLLSQTDKTKIDFGDIS